MAGPGPHYRVRGASDRHAKRARCSCGWEGPWRSTKPTGRRRRDAQLRYRLVAADYREHHAAAHADEGRQ